MKKKFSLIELITVIAILAILATILIPNVGDMKKGSIMAMVNSNIRILQTASDMYALDNGGKKPTNIEPTLGKPQLINFDLLYPKYIKSLPKEDNISKQNYWVDYTGRVWGATVDSPSNIFHQDNQLEWNYDKNVVSYNFYEIKNENTPVSGNSKLSTTPRLSLFKSLIIKESSEIIKVTLEDANSSDMLISSVDIHGLETAPVSLEYEGKPQFPEFPKLLIEGEFELTLSSTETMYWDGFRAVEDRPPGTSIEYSFAVGDNKDTLGEYTTDFYSLEPAKYISIKIKMTSYEGQYPSLYDIRIFYHFKNDEVLSPIEQQVVENKIIDKYKLGNGQYVKDIIVTDSYIKDKKPSTSYYYSMDDENYYAVSSPREIPSGAYVIIQREYPTGYHLDKNTRYGSPVVFIKEEPPVVREYKIKKDNTVGNNDLSDDTWETFQTISYFVSTSDGQKVHWISVDIQDYQPENTRILYRFATSNTGIFGEGVDSVDQLSDSQMLKITAYLQIKKNETVNEYPYIISIKVNHSNGSENLDLLKPTGVIIPRKSNNHNTSTISTETIVDWDYEVSDPKGREIVEVEWGGDKRSQYEEGTYTVTIRFKNDIGLWSNLIEYTFNVYEEKPVAVLKTAGSYVSSKPIKLDTNASYDPDGDGIQKIEWGGDYRSDLTYEPGIYEIRMRVQDAEGNWSDWVSRIIRVEEYVKSDPQYGQDNLANYQGEAYGPGPTIGEEQSEKSATVTFPGLPAAALDGDLNTYAQVADEYRITLEGDTAYRLVKLTMQITSQYGGGYTMSLFVQNASKKNINFIRTNEDFTSESIVNKLSLNPTQGKTTFYIVLPEGAKYIYIDTGANGNNRIFEISSEEGYSPAPVYDFYYIPTETGITLKWKTPNTDVQKVAVYRNNSFIGYSTTNEFTDSPLFTDTEYSYTLYTINSKGHRGAITYNNAKTDKAPVVWRGLDGPAAFDGDLNTYSTESKGTRTITWTGDLSNRLVTIKARVNSDYAGSNTMTLKILNASNSAISFIRVQENTESYVSQLKFERSVIHTYSFIMPKDGAKIQLTMEGNVKNANIFEIIHDFAPSPTSLKNLDYDVEDDSITIYWDQEPNTKVAVYLGNTFLGYYNQGMFKREELLANTTYSFKLQAINQYGHRSDFVTYNIKTLSSLYNFSGLANNRAFDEDLETYIEIAKANFPVNITWTGDYITGREILFKWKLTSGFSSANTVVMKVLDASNAPLEFTVINKANNTSYKTTTFTLTEKSQPSLTYFILPLEAVKMNFTAGANVKHVRFYEFLVQ